MDEYAELAVLGRGSLGESRQLQHRASAEKVTAKELKFPVQRLTPQLQEKFYRTIEKLAKLRHPCINSLLGSFRVSDSGGTILSPYIDGMSLKTVIDEGPGDWLSPTVMTIIVLGITLAMRFAHENGIFHGALTPSNVIIDTNHHAHVSDFGSLYYQRLGIVCEQPTEAQLYHDQDMANDDDDSQARCDTYSFGVILYEITMMGKGSPAVLRRITLNKLLQGRRPDVPTTTLPFTRSLIEACWADHGVQRPTFDKIYQLMEMHDFRLFDQVDVQAVGLFVDSVSAAIIDDLAA
jgi:serine/threonine protein kinase